MPVGAQSLRLNVLGQAPLRPSVMPSMAGRLAFRDTMVITEQICEEVVTDEALAEFQRKLGLPIPACYREFLKVHNGGRPGPSRFEFKGAEGKVEKDNVHYPK